MKTNKNTTAPAVKPSNAGNSELLAALEAAAKFICTARQYFPKSVRNSDRFQLEITSAHIGKAIHAAKGGAL